MDRVSMEELAFMEGRKAKRMEAVICRKEIFSSFGSLKTLNVLSQKGYLPNMLHSFASILHIQNNY